MSKCSKHGEVEFLPPDANGNSYCKLCFKEWMSLGIPEEFLLEGVPKDALAKLFTDNDSVPTSMGCTVHKDNSCPLCGPPEVRKAYMESWEKRVAGGRGRLTTSEIGRKLFSIEPMPEGAMAP